jgi:fructose-bisphosphate aldolase class II/6-phospho-5-dehydro-2-deoxy-D-gluconate aldolase
MAAIAEATNASLVLHGGSGIPAEQIKKAIERGHSKINVNTECQQHFTANVRDFLANDGDVYDPRKYMNAGKQGIKDVVIEKATIFGSLGQAK